MDLILWCLPAQSLRFAINAYSKELVSILLWTHGLSSVTEPVGLFRCRWVG